MFVTSESVNGVLYFPFGYLAANCCAHSSQTSCNSLSTCLSFLFGLRVELEFKSIPEWKDKLVVSANLRALKRSENPEATMRFQF